MSANTYWLRATAPFTVLVGSLALMALIPVGRVQSGEPVSRALQCTASLMLVALEEKNQGRDWEFPTRIMQAWRGKLSAQEDARIQPVAEAMQNTLSLQEIYDTGSVCADELAVANRASCQSYAAKAMDSATWHYKAGMSQAAIGSLNNSYQYTWDHMRDGCRIISSAYDRMRETACPDDTMNEIVEFYNAYRLDLPNAKGEMFTISCDRF